jgi:hypothetical protein
MARKVKTQMRGGLQEVPDRWCSAQTATIRFRLSRVPPDSQLSGHEDISVSSLLAAAAAHRAGPLGATAADLRIAA